MNAKRFLLNLLKFAVPAAIIAYLLSRLEPDQLQQLQSRDKNWWRLSGAFAIVFAIVSLSFVRWWLLVVSLGLQFRLRDAFRLGFLGYLLNFVSVGAVGGDLFKAVFIAREQPGRRAEAVATVLVDRVVGLYALLVVAMSAILLTGAGGVSPQVKALCDATLLFGVVGTAGVIAVVLLPFQGRISIWAGRLPVVGTALRRVIAGVHMYKRRPLAMAIISLISLAVHSGLAAALWLIATGLYSQAPSLSDHLVMAPLAMVAGAIPFTPGGLGALEWALDELYRLVPVASHVASGLLVALSYRLICLAVAAVGAVYYFASRSEFDQLMAEAAAEAQRGADTAADSDTDSDA